MTDLEAIELLEDALLGKVPGAMPHVRARMQMSSTKDPAPGQAAPAAVDDSHAQVGDLVHQVAQRFKPAPAICSDCGYMSPPNAEDRATRCILNSLRRLDGPNAVTPDWCPRMQP